MNFRELLRRLSGLLPVPALLLLAACATLPEPAARNWEQHRAAVAMLQQWALRGRLNIRENRQSDTVSLNWEQTSSEFSIRLSSTVLGLGATYLHGDENSVILEKSGAETRVLPGLDALSRDYLGYDFPAAYLRYWVRGLPVPTLREEHSLNPQNLLQNLIQTDAGGQRWELTFDRYQQVDAQVLPGRIRLQSQGVQLTFLIDSWQLTATGS